MHRGAETGQSGNGGKYRGGTRFALVLIAFVGVLAYYNSLTVPFLLDDYSSIVRNGVITDLGAFLSGAGYRYNPRRFIGYLTIALNYRMGGLDITGYHLFNLGIHLSCGWLVYALGMATFRTPFFAQHSGPAGNPGGKDSAGRGATTAPGSRDHRLIALFAALLFIAHPIQTQAVTYVIQRLASLCTLFYLLSLVLYAAARLLGDRSKGRILTVSLYLASLASALLAMETKEIAFTLPLAVLLYEVMFFRISALKRLLLLAPVLLTALVVPVTLLGVGKPLTQMLAELAQRTRVDSTLPRLHYLYTQFRVLVTYLRLLVFPAGQNLDYDYPVYRSLLAPPVLLSLFTLLAILGAALYLIRATGKVAPAGAGGSPGLRPELRLVSFGILWFFLTLSVESSLIPIADPIFEHRLYLATPGVFLALASLLFCCTQALPRRPVVVGAGLVVAVLAVLTVARNAVWRDSVELARDTVAKSPGKARPHYNLAEALSKAGWIEESLKEAALAARLDPSKAEPYALMGLIHLASGQNREAARELSRAVALVPNYLAARSLFGDALAGERMWPEALEQYRAALKLNPGDPDTYNKVGLVHFVSGQPREAADYFASALRLSPGNTVYRSNFDRARLELTARGSRRLSPSLTLPPRRRDFPIPS